jgi:hypothetical protein
MNNKTDKLIFWIEQYYFHKQIQGKKKYDIIDATTVVTSLTNLNNEKVDITFHDIVCLKKGYQINTLPTCLFEGSFSQGEIFPDAKVTSEWIFYYRQLSKIEPKDKFILITSLGDFEFEVEEKAGGFWSNLFG